MYVDPLIDLVGHGVCPRPKDDKGATQSRHHLGCIGVEIQPFAVGLDARLGAALFDDVHKGGGRMSMISCSSKS